MQIVRDKGYNQINQSLQWPNIVPQITNLLNQIIDTNFILGREALSYESGSNSSPSSGSGPGPGSDSESSETYLKIRENISGIISSLDNHLKKYFQAYPPQTILRLSELLLYPNRHSSKHQAFKYLRAIERCIRVTETAVTFSDINESAKPELGHKSINYINGEEIHFSMELIPWLRDSDDDQDNRAGDRSMDEDTVHDEMMIDEDFGENITENINICEDTLMSDQSPIKTPGHGHPPTTNIEINTNR